jgi:hypothetical protein
MPKTVYRSIGSSTSSRVRRSPRPRGQPRQPTGAFEALLIKLGFASEQLSRSRRRR